MMKNSLIILIVLVIVILAVIFWTSPTCRKGVTSIFKPRQRKAEAELDRKSNRDPAQDAIKRQREVARRDIPVAAKGPLAANELDRRSARDPATEALKSQADALRQHKVAAQGQAMRSAAQMAAAGRRFGNNTDLDRQAIRDPAGEAIRQQREAVRRGVPVATPQQPVAASQDAKADFLRKRREAQGKAQGRMPGAARFQPTQLSDERQGEEEEKPVDVKLVPQPTQQVVQHRAFRTLNGNVEDLFNTKIDVQSEFGISEETLNVMAADYKKRHLDTPKPEVLRNRSIRKSELERSEQVLRSSFVNAASLNTRMNTEEFTVNAMRKNIMTAESGREKPIRSKMNAFNPRTE